MPSSMQEEGALKVSGLAKRWQEEDRGCRLELSSLSNCNVGRPFDIYFSPYVFSSLLLQRCQFSYNSFQNFSPLDHFNMAETPGGQKGPWSFTFRLSSAAFQV